MSNSIAGPTPSADLPDALIQGIDSLDHPGLKSALSDIERRIETLRTPIGATAAGEVLKIETHGLYALVRTHPPDPDGPGVIANLVALYHVHLEPQMDGRGSLRWGCLGDVRNSEQIRCDTCGGTLDTDTSVCPHCGSANADTAETEK